MEVTRRKLLAGSSGGIVAIGSGRAVYNVLLGYGTITGTNLLEQDLDPLVAENLEPTGGHVADVDGYAIDYREGSVRVLDGRRVHRTLDTESASDDSADAAAVDRELELAGGPLEELVDDLGDLAAGEVRFEYDSYPAFFETVAAGDARPFTVQALRGRRTADPDVVETFTGVDPSDPEAVIEGLVGGFREHTSYDFRRYVAGSIEDNILFGRRDLRQRYESPTDFEALMAGEDTGLFCYELTRRSVEALQSVPAPEQRAPVVAGYVRDARHKHVYTIVASAIRDRDDELVVPVTFVDYTHSTQYDDLRLRRVLGEGLDAYGDGHRATSVDWYH